MRTLAIVGHQAQALHPHLNVKPLTIKDIDLQCALVPMPAAQPRPDQLRGRQVLVRTEAFSCNYRDQGLLLEAYLGNPDTCLWPIGSEFCGTVQATGPEVQGLKPGDRVLGNNAYIGNQFVQAQSLGVVTNNASLEYQIYPQEQLLRVPDCMDSLTAAGFSLGAQTAYSMVRKARLQRGDHVLIMSATSNTSLFILGALHARGIEMTLCSSSTKAAEIAAQYGAAFIPVSDHTEERLRSRAQEIGGFCAVLDPFMDMNAGIALPALRPGGRYVTCGFLNQVKHDYDYQAPHRTLLYDLIGQGIVNNIELHFNCLGETRDLEAALDDYRQGKLTILIDSVFGEGQEKFFLERTFENRERLGKVIFHYGGQA
ncbi:alcohol dehydrogenase [Deinococcus piscis]|uniref:Alcohol dehydrogenase n=1 Tax=Deinococcus piscis TaxID=394230 RepID=A0ABQ3K9A6_9DEIO|nr:zinc-binding alcohol dehydrogenase family protein [Deinococcus piscis]GHG05248.1 alcohol dehydrogenase [Deinococcus piscis]